MDMSKVVWVNGWLNFSASSYTTIQSLLILTDLLAAKLVEAIVEKNKDIC
jgi:hypothetical protein